MSFTNAGAEDADLAEWLCGVFPTEFLVSPHEQVLKYCSPNTVAAEYVDSHANEVAKWVHDGLAPVQQHITYANCEDFLCFSSATPFPTGKSPYLNLWMQPVHSSHWFVICARIWV